MALYQVSSGSTINAADVNQLVQVLQQPSGGQEVGTYYLSSFATAAGQTISEWIESRSRGATPVSVSFDQSIVATNQNNPSSDVPDANGFRMFMVSSASNNNVRVAGHWTIQY